MNAIVKTQATEIQVGVVGQDWQRAAADWSMNLKSERTRQSYLNAWRDFLAFAQKSPADVDQSDVIEYRHHLKTTPSPKTKKPLSQSSINQRLSALSSFFAFAVDRGLLAKNPVDGVSRESVTPYGKASWLNVNRDEDRRLLELPDVETIQGKRDRALLAVFLNRGLRISEVAGMTVGDLYRTGSGLGATIRRKGGDDVRLALGKFASTAIEEYLATREGLDDDSPVFTATEAGRKAAASIGRYNEGEEKPLSTRAIRYLVNTYATKLFGKGHNIHPHSLRHTAARRLDKEGVGFRSISSFMGHASGQVTTVYLQSIASDAEVAVDALDSVYS